MIRRLADAIKGLVALLALVLVVGGPPVALIHFVGWPFPSRIPGLDEMTTAARSGIDDLVVVKALAVLAWLSWSQLALAAVVEVGAAVRDRQPRRAPVVPFVRVPVARLVATTALLFASFHSPRAQPIPLATLAAAVAQPHTYMAVQEMEPDRPAPPSAVPVKSEDPAGAVEYVVREGDSWWGIAQAELGDGRLWKEVRSANIGRSMPDGTVIGAQTEIIRKDWQILVPRPGAATSPVKARQAVPTGEVIVQPGDSLWTIAETHLRQSHDAPVSKAELDGYWRRLIEANRERLAHADDPNQIYSGQRIVLPPIATNGGEPTSPAELANAPAPTTLPVPTTPEEPSAPSVTRPARSTSTETSTPRRRARAATAPPTKLPAQAGRPRATPPAASRKPNAHATPIPASGSRAPAIGMLGAASTMLAVGIAAALRRRHRRRLLQLAAKAQPPVPAEEFDELRSELCLRADPDSATRLHQAMLDIAMTLAARRSDARPRLIQVSGRRIEALLSSAVLPAPEGWRTDASGSAWVLDGEPAQHHEQPGIPSPLLVSVGAPDTKAELYLDLEAEGVLTITGEPDQVADVARSWILELATSPLAAGVSVAVLGPELAPAPDVSERLNVLGSWEQIADDALAWAEQSTALIAANRWPTAMAGRVRTSRADDLAPLILFVPDPPTDERFEMLCTAIAHQQLTVAVVVVGADIEGATRIEISGGELRIPSLGLTCQAQATTIEAVAQVAELLDDATRLPAQLALIPPPDAPPPLVATECLDGHYCDPPYEILVRFLGDIGVVGASRDLTPKQMAVFAYIALNAPVSSERVEDALWVATTVSRRKRLANTISECRAAIGAPHLPFANDGRYRVGPGVVTDIELFDRRVAHAAQQSAADAVDTLRGALELVEGPVFTYRNAERSSYVWVSVHNWISTWELKVADTAEELAQRYLDLDDPEGAIWAARRGLRASEIHSRLTKLLIQAYVANGDLRAAEQVFVAHQTALDGLDLDEVDPELVDLYRELRQPRGVAAS